MKFDLSSIMDDAAEAEGVEVETAAPVIPAPMAKAAKAIIEKTPKAKIAKTTQTKVKSAKVEKVEVAPAASDLTPEEKADTVGLPPGMTLAEERKLLGNWLAKNEGRHLRGDKKREYLGTVEQGMPAKEEDVKSELPATLPEVPAPTGDLEDN